jgi:hypothetical protein
LITPLEDKESVDAAAPEELAVLKLDGSRDVELARSEELAAFTIVTLEKTSKLDKPEFLSPLDEA